MGEAVSPLFTAGVGLTWSNQFTQGVHMAAEKDHRVSKPFTLCEGGAGSVFCEHLLDYSIRRSNVCYTFLH